MLTIEKALEAVFSHARRLPGRSSPVAEARGCRLDEDVVADLDLPPFDKALVDGYALRTSDVARPGTLLRIGEEITAGRMPTRPLGAGEAAAVMTGAPLPDGTDAVVMIESTRRSGPNVSIDEGVRAGQNVLARGREMRAGERVLGRGERLGPAGLGVLASVGRTHAVIVPRPHLAIVPTGDELVEPDRVPGPGQIRNSNGSVLRALAESSGATVASLPIAPDEHDRLQARLSQGMEADLLLVTGGVSAGRLDLVPDALLRLGVEPVFHKVRVRPGKPLWFGVGPSRPERPRCLVFGLPGNPVSGMVGFLLFARPAIEILSGGPAAAAPTQRVRLNKPFRHTGERRTFHPARLLATDSESDPLPTIEPVDWAGSADLRAVARSDGFAIFPEGDRTYEPGDVVGFLALG